MAVWEAEIALDAGDPAWQHYYRLRSQIETPENIGKLILFDVDSGDYEIAEDDLGIKAVGVLRVRHPDADVFCLRIGYEAVCSFNGGLERLPPIMRGTARHRQGILPVTFQLPGQPGLALEFVVDTGFTGK